MSEPRIRLLLREDMSEAQLAAHDAIASGPRGVVRGPTLLWLHSPQYAGLIQKVGEFLRWSTVLDQRLSELAILVTTRHTNCHFMWFNHVGLALKHGLPDAVVEDIKHRRTPRFEREDERAVYDFATQMLTRMDADDEIVERVKSLFGERGAIELGAIIGHYFLGSITVATARIPLPDGTMKCLPD